MSLIPCPECKKNISESAENCPNCGYKLTPEKISKIKENQKKNSQGVGIGCLIIVIILIVICAIPSTDSSKKKLKMLKREDTASSLQSKPIVLPKYQIVEVEDVSFNNVKRYRVRSYVDKILSYRENELVSEKIIAEITKSKSSNAISIFYYLPESDINSSYTAGMAEWAPYGDWSKADEIITGDYSKHQLKVSQGNALGIDSEKVKVIGITLERKKKIFFDLVSLQNSGFDNEKAYDEIANKYHVDVKLVRKIATEGIVQGWPMP